MSVITPTYNAEKFLPKAFESVLKQTIGFENIQYILYDDASTDGTPEMIDRYAAKYPNVIARHMEKNSGNAGAPRNAAMKLAEAELIMFLDNDDAFFPDACRALYDAMQDGADIASGFWRSRADKNSVWVGEERDFATNVQAGDYSLENCSFETGAFFANDFWTKIYRKSIIDRYAVQFNEGNMLEDLAFLYQYLVHCRVCRVVETGVIDYYIRSSSHGHTRGVSFFTQMPKSLDFALEKVRACGKEEAFFELLGRYCLVEYAVDMMMLSKSFGEDEVREVLKSFQGWLRLAYERQFNLPSTYAKILTHGAAHSDLDTQVFNFIALRDLYWQRKEELDNIFGSTTWKLASAAQKLKFW